MSEMKTESEIKQQKKLIVAKQRTPRKKKKFPK